MSWLGDAWHGLEDGAASVLGIDGPSQSDTDQQSVNQANQRGNQQRGQYNSRAKQLEQQAGGGYDPAAITKQTNWAAMDHGQIKQIADGLKPSDIGTHGNDWINLGKDLQTSTDTFNNAINTALNGNWTGVAGDAALAAPRGIVSWGQDFGNQMQATGAQAQSVSATADQVKATVPPPKDFSWGKTLLSGAIGGPFGAGASAYAQHQEQQQAKEQAVRVMSAVYSPNYMNAASTMPAFTGPTDPTQPPGSHPPGGHPPVYPPIVEPKPVYPPGGGKKPSTYKPNQVGGPNHPGGTTQPQQLNKPAQPGNPPDVGENQHIPGMDHQTGTTTQGTGWTPPGTGTDSPGGYPGTGYPGGQGGGSGQGGGGFMPPMGAPSSGGSGYGGSGSGFGSAGGAKGFAGTETSAGANRTGAGAAAGIGAEEEGAMRGGAAAGRPGTAGAAGAGGMSAGGRGGKKEEDKEHKSAAYLVNDDNANDIVGDLPPTVPPVIGG